MNRIRIINNNDIVFVTFVENSSEIKLRELIGDTEYEIYKKKCSDYDRKDTIGSYWIEFDGAIFDDTKSFQCNCDMDFTFKFTIVSRNSVNTMLKYDGTQS